MKNTDSISARCDEAYELARQERYDDALAICNEVSTVPGGKIPAFRERAAILSRQGNYLEALASIEQVVSLGSEEPADYYKKGSICFLLGEYQESINALSLAIEICEREGEDYYSTATRFIRAEAYRRIGDYDSAIDDCDALGEGYRFYLPGQEGEKSANQIRDESIAAKKKSSSKQWEFGDD